MDIGYGLHIVHAGNIRINALRIGDNFIVYHGVTIGSGKDGKCPIIGNNVTCYSNCVVCGGISVGDGSKIGATAFLNKDLEPNSTVVSQCIVKEKY